MLAVSLSEGSSSCLLSIGVSKLLWRASSKMWQEPHCSTFAYEVIVAISLEIVQKGKNRDEIGSFKHKSFHLNIDLLSTVFSFARYVTVLNFLPEFARDSPWCPIARWIEYSMARKPSLPLILYHLLWLRSCVRVNLRRILNRTKTWSGSEKKAVLYSCSPGCL